MYKILLVDDEPLILESLKKTIGWESLNTQVVGTACNGQQALRFIQTNAPDIVLSDIRMPVMDGLELAKAAKEIRPEIRIVLISGYDDFAYAQQALRIGVEDYVLKPIKNQTVEEAIRQIVSAIQASEKAQRGMEQVRRQYGTIVRDALLNGCHTRCT